MRDIRRSSVPTLSRSPVSPAVSAEPLEGRRLFAGFGPHGHEFVSPGFVVGLMMPGRMPPSATWQGGLFGGGRMLVVNDGTTVTAFGINASAVESSVTDVSVNTNSASAPTAVGFRPANIQTTPHSTSTSTSAETAVVRQVMDAAAANVTPADADAARQAVAVDEPSFGPFVVKMSETQTPAKPAAESGLVNLLAINAERRERLNQWTADSLGRSRRDANAAAVENDDATLPTMSADAVVVQAALPILPGDVSMRPVWQRVAIFTAGGVVVAANWIVRRRQRRLAAGVMRQA